MNASYSRSPAIDAILKDQLYFTKMKTYTFLARRCFGTNTVRMKTVRPTRADVKAFRVIFAVLNTAIARK